MWTRDLLKMNAKQVLRNNYWMALLVAFVASPVSYTHLDVYKRQARFSRKTVFRPSSPNVSCK